jgi:hypothetical protein
MLGEGAGEVEHFLFLFRCKKGFVDESLEEKKTWMVLWRAERQMVENVG